MYIVLFNLKGLYIIKSTLSFKITILLKDVTSMTKEKTAKLIPNAIQISTDNEKVWLDHALASMHLPIILFVTALSIINSFG